MSLLTPRFESVRELEEWISTIQFNYVGSSPQKSATAAQCYELSNNEDKTRQQQQQQQSNTPSKNESNPPPPSMPEQVVEILVKILRTGMRTGLRGALEVIKVLDRLPETIFVPVPTSSFTASQLEKPSRWFKSPEDWENYVRDQKEILKMKQLQQNGKGGGALTSPSMKSGGANDGIPNSGIPNDAFFFPSGVTDKFQFDLVPLPTKFVRSALFVVNSAASTALSNHSSPTFKQQQSGGPDEQNHNNQNNSTPPNSSSSSSTLLPKTAASQLRMFLRLCLQQRCLLAVVELLVGFLKHPSDGSAISDFLYVHPSANPLIDELAFPQIMECVRKFGGPPLVIRAAAAQCNLSIGPLLESPWDPEVAANISADSPLTASWSMWFASKGLRLKWNLEYNLPDDNSFPDYVIVESSGLNSFSIGNGVSVRNNNNQNQNNDDAFSGFDDAGSVGGGGKRVIRRIVKKTATTKAGGNSTGRSSTTTTTTTVVTSPGINNNNNYIDPNDQQQQEGHKKSFSGLSNNNSFSSAPQQQGESPRPSTAAVVVSTIVTSTTTPIASSSARGNNNVASQRPPLSPSTTNSNNNNNTTSISVSSSPNNSRDSASSFTFASKAQVEKNIQLLNENKMKEIAFVDDVTNSKWRDERANFQSSIAEAVQPLLEAYTKLVQAKWAVALSQNRLSESRLMECLDVDVGIDSDLMQQLEHQHDEQHHTPAQHNNHKNNQQQQNYYEDDDDDDDNEFERPIKDHEEETENNKRNDYRKEEVTKKQNNVDEEDEDSLAW